MLKIPRHNGWDMKPRPCQRIDDVVPVESSRPVPLCRTVDHVIAGGTGASTFMRNPLAVCVCVAAFGLNVISDVQGGGQNEILCYQASHRSQPNIPLLAAPSRHKGAQGRLSTRSSKLNGCRAEVER